MKKKKKLCIKLDSKKFRAIYYWGKFIGVNALSLSKKNELEYSYISLLYGCFLILMYSYIYYCTLIQQLSILLSNEISILATILDILAISWKFLEISSTWFVFAIYQNRMKIIVKSFVIAEKTSEKLGITDDCDKQFKEFGVQLLIYNILYLVSLNTSNVMWSFFDSFDLFLWTQFSLPALTSFNTGIIFIWCLILVRRKFRRLNQTVQFLMQNSNVNEEDQVSSGLIRQSGCHHDSLLDRINIVSQLHRELRDIIYHVEEYFALFGLFSIGNSFSFLTFNSYRIYCDMRGHARESVDLIYLVAVSHSMLYPVAMLIVISNICGSTSEEANNTGNMLHKLLNRCEHMRDVRETDKCTSLSLDLLQNQVSMSVFGLLKLDNFLIYRTIAAVTSCLTIMLQLYD